MRRTWVQTERAAKAEALEVVKEGDVGWVARPVDVEGLADCRVWEGVEMVEEVDLVDEEVA